MKDTAAAGRAPVDGKRPGSRGPRRPTGRQLYQLKVTLLDTRPPVWRRLLVRGDTTLDLLHEIIQAAMGWYNSHLHTFTVDRVEYSMPNPEWDVVDERKVTLQALGLGPGRQFQYMYDMGDGWRHEIRVEKLVEAESAHPERAVCLAGRRACPPEDVGGTYGYRLFLRAMANPKHRDHREMVEWIGRDFDPEDFDVEDVNVELGDF